MKKISRLPREQVGADQVVEGDGVRQVIGADDDVEGHVGHTKGERFSPRLPGTGGDFRRPSGGGEVVEDVEG